VPIAAFVGRMIRPKGIDVLMQAHDRLRQRGTPMKLELYGATDADNSEAITAEVLTTWCTRHDARWLGHVTDVHEVWRHADIFVLPARSREGMPRALLEAAACARPLVVTDVPGCRHFVRDGVEGFLVDSRDPHDFARSCLQLMTSRGERLAMGDRARRRVAAHFRDTQMAEAHRQLYFELSEQAAGSTPGTTRRHLLAAQELS